MNLIYGRYAVAAVWYGFILGRCILDNTFLPPATDGDTIKTEGIQLIKETVHAIILG